MFQGTYHKFHYFGGGMKLVFCGKKFYQKRFSDCLEHGDKYLKGNKLMTGYIFSADISLTA